MGFSRRTILGGTLAGAGALSGLVPMTTAQSAVRERRDVNNLINSNSRLITDYEDAVGQMRDLPADDPRNWNNLARIHQRFCPHSNWYFLYWHRAFIHQFEAIVRQLSRNSNFMLPYWDWTNNPQIPSAFWSGSLNHPRGLGEGEDLFRGSVGQPALDRVMRLTEFRLFGGASTTDLYDAAGAGRLEGNPHNAVHIEVGRDMRTLNSPRDPIFWLHHANVDRLWASWNAVEGNDNPDDADFTSFVFSNENPDRNGRQRSTHFLTANGSGDRRYRISAMQTTERMGYQYQRLEQAPSSAVASASRNSALETVMRDVIEQPVSQTVGAGQALSATFAIGEGVESLVAETGRQMNVSSDSSSVSPAVSRITTAYLVLRDIMSPENDSTIRVFLNHENPTPDTSIDDPHYVGSATFFGHGADDSGICRAGGKRFTFLMDLTPTIGALRAQGQDIGGKLTPQVVAVRPDGSGSAISMDGKFEIELAERLG